MKPNPMTIVVVSIFVFLAAFVWYAKTHPDSTSSASDLDIVSKNGLHAHPELEIYVKGQKVTIPENIGLTGVEKPIHTHGDLPLIHLEFPGTVTRDDIRLKEFFKVWGKDFYSFGTTVTMTVNGEPNTELGNYEMHDKDNIVLNYE